MTLNVITTTRSGEIMEPLIRDGRARKLSFPRSTGWVANYWSNAPGLSRALTFFICAWATWKSTTPATNQFAATMTAPSAAPSRFA
jgi:hypothetical protein